MAYNLEALDLLAAGGSVGAAWAIARRDEGLLEGVTQAEWLVYARRAIANRAAVAAANAHVSID